MPQSREIPQKVIFPNVSILLIDHPELGECYIVKVNHKGHIVDFRLDDTTARAVISYAEAKVKEHGPV